MRTDVKQREFWEWRDHTPLYRHPMLRKHSICLGRDTVKQWRVLGCETLVPVLEARHEHGYTAVA